MRTAHSSREATSYLDVSEYIIKEHSPMIKPASPVPALRSDVKPPKLPLCSSPCISAGRPADRQLSILSPLTIQNTRHEHTPEIEPIDHDPSQFMLTPITSGLIRQEIEDIMEDFILDSNEAYLYESKSEGKRRKRTRCYHRDSMALKMFRLDCELERIIEDEDENSYCSLSEDDSESEEVSEDEHCFGNSNTMFSLWTTKNKSKDSSHRDTEEEKQTAIDLAAVDYSDSIERFSSNPKAEINSKIREIEAMANEGEEEKKQLIKKYLEKYLLEYEAFCYEQSWKELNLSLKSTVETVLEGIDETFKKTIGTLPFEHRRIKLLKYLQKKKKRIWRKKVSYDCRKKVADGRLRIKGKFVTREQACETLGLESLGGFSPEEIKDMLERKMEETLQESIVC